jgi:VanZ family protein
MKMLKNNKFSILAALIIMYLSLANSHTFDKVPLINIPHIDKFVHFGMYFSLMSIILLENRKTIITTGHLFVSAIIPLFYGILMEILQSVFTLTRSGSFYDALADTTGIIASIVLWLILKPHIKQIFR